MFNNPKYLTRCVENDILGWLINLMWHMVLNPEVEQNYLQIFRLTKTECGQHIIHEQEQPPYKKELMCPARTQWTQRSTSLTMTRTARCCWQKSIKKLQEDRKMNQNTYVCTNYSAEHPIDELYTVGDDLLCEDCADRFTLVCNECGVRIYEDDAITDDNHILCQNCFDNHYERCHNCDCIVHHYS